MNIHPTQSFRCETFVLFCLCLIILKEENANKEVEEEETTNQDENDEKDHSLEIELLLRTLSLLCDIKRIDHDIGPTFQTGDDEQSSHGVTNIVKVVIENGPLATSSLTLQFGMESVHIN